MLPPEIYTFSDASEHLQLPLVLDSPHSGRWLPPDLLALPNPDDGAGVEDRHVDDLCMGVEQLGAALLLARVSRQYIDLNRHPETPGERDTAGDGLIRPWPGQPVPLPQDEVRRRVQQVWQPYHTKLSGVLAQRRQRFGGVLHLNMHSMPSRTQTASGVFPDIVLGNRHGQSASADTLEFMTALLRKRGLRVSLNDPFSGVEILRRHGNPAGGVQSVQVEISRALFLDEASGSKSNNFQAAHALLQDLVRQLGGMLQTGAQAAE